MTQSALRWIHRISERVRAVDEEGQSLVEYGLIVGLIAVICIGIVSAIGTNTNALLQNLANSIASVT